MRDIRARTGINMIDFCKKYHIPYSTYQKWEYGINRPPKYVKELLKFKVEMENK